MKRFNFYFLLYMSALLWGTFSLCMDNDSKKATEAEGIVAQIAAGSSDEAAELTTHFNTIFLMLQNAHSHALKTLITGVVLVDREIVEYLRTIKAQKGKLFYDKLMALEPVRDTSTNFRSLSLFNQAIFFRNLPAIAELAQDCDPNIITQGSHPIKVAAETGCQQVLKAVVDAKSDVNTPLKLAYGSNATADCTVFYFVVLENRPEMVQFLLSYTNANVLLKDFSFLAAARSMLPDIIETKQIKPHEHDRLEQEKNNNEKIIALIEAFQDERDTQKQQPSDYIDPKLIVETIVDCMYQKNAMAMQKLNKLKAVLTKKQYNQLLKFTFPIHSQSTLLMFAGYYGEIAVMKQLLLDGANVDAISPQESNALLFAMGSTVTNVEEKRMVIRELLKGGAQVGIFLKRPGGVTTALVGALELNDPTIVALLLEDQNIDFVKTDYISTAQSIHKAMLAKAQAKELVQMRSKHKEIITLLENYWQKKAALQKIKQLESEKRKRDKQADEENKLIAERNAMSARLNASFNAQNQAKKQEKDDAGHVQQIAVKDTKMNRAQRRKSGQQKTKEKNGSDHLYAIATYLALPEDQRKVEDDKYNKSIQARLKQAHDAIIVQDQEDAERKAQYAQAQELERQKIAAQLEREQKMQDDIAAANALARQLREKERMARAQTDPKKTKSFKKSAQPPVESAAQAKTDSAPKKKKKPSEFELYQAGVERSIQLVNETLAQQAARREAIKKKEEEEEKDWIRRGMEMTQFFQMPKSAANPEALPLKNKLHTDWHTHQAFINDPREAETAIDAHCEIDAI